MNDSRHSAMASGAPAMDVLAQKQTGDGKSAQLRQLQSYAKGTRGKQIALFGLKNHLTPPLKQALVPAAQFTPKTPLKEIGNNQREVQDMHQNVDNDEPEWMRTPKYHSPKRKLELDGGELIIKKRRETEPSPSPLHGLRNIGNSCYMNAILQAILSLTSFKNDMRQPGLVDANMPENGVFRALQQILQAMESSSNKVISPAALKSSIEKNSARFRGMFQQDAHEFLCDLLDQLQAEVYAYHEKSRLHSANPKLRLSTTDCPTTKNFSCFVRHDLRCNSCGHSNTVEELFRHFPLDLPQNEAREANGDSIEEPVHLVDLLRCFFRDEIYEKTCERCGSNGCTVKRVIRRLPRVLVLHLKRFSVDELTRQFKKNSRQVFIPQTLDLEFCCSETTKGPLAVGEIPKDDHFASLSSARLSLDQPSTPRPWSWSPQEPLVGPASNVEEPLDEPTPDEDSELEKALQASMDDYVKLTKNPNGEQELISVEDEDLNRAIAMSLQGAFDSATTENGKARPHADNVLSNMDQNSHVQDIAMQVPAVIEVDDSDTDGEPASKGFQKYVLQGIVSHLGPLVSSGHFVADVLDANRQQWLRYDDSVVSPVSESDAFRRNRETEAYLLFYVHQEIALPIHTPEKQDVKNDKAPVQYFRRSRPRP